MFHFTFNSRKQTALHIESPCSENWDAMQNRGNNKFCLSCSKEVKDFTLMSDAQILDYLKNHTANSCGRFYTDQLMRPLEEPKPRKHSLYGKFIAACLLFFNFIPVKLNAQAVNHKKIEIDYNGDTLHASQKTEIKEEGSPSHEVCTAVNGDLLIRGAVYNAKTKNFVNHVYMELLGFEEICCFSNSTGVFELTIPDSLVTDSMVLSVYAYGYDSIKYRIDKNNLPSFLRLFMQGEEPPLRSVMFGCYGGSVPTGPNPVRYIDALKKDENLTITPATIHPNLKGEMDERRLVE